MASNNHTRAILRLRGTIPKRQVDLLLALETFTPDDDGWREAGADLIDTETNISPRTAARARGELIAAGWLDYDRGDGRGHVSRYRVRLPHVPKKGRQNADSKGRQNGESRGSQDDDMATFKGRQEDPVKVATEPDKGRHRNPATSGDVIGALKESALKPSAARTRDAPAHPPAPAHPRTREAAADLDGHAEGAWSGQPDDDDFDYETRPRRSPGLGQCAVCGGWFLAVAGGVINRHTGTRPDGSYGTCPGARQPPVRPVRCTGPCGRTGLALASLTGLCSACTRERKEAEAEEWVPGAWRSRPGPAPEEDPR